MQRMTIHELKNALKRAYYNTFKAGKSERSEAYLISFLALNGDSTRLDLDSEEEHDERSTNDKQG